MEYLNYLIIIIKVISKIKAQDNKLYTEMKKFHETIASPSQKSSELIYKKYSGYFQSEKLEIDLRDEAEW